MPLGRKLKRLASGVRIGRVNKAKGVAGVRKSEQRVNKVKVVAGVGTKSRPFRLSSAASKLATAAAAASLTPAGPSGSITAARSSRSAKAVDVHAGPSSPLIPEIPSAKERTRNNSDMNVSASKAIETAKSHLFSVPKALVSLPTSHGLSSSYRRIQKDLKQLYQDTPIGIQVMHDDDNLTLVHALITGPVDTPYEGGFFYFLIRFGEDYPSRPPKVQFMTTDGGRVRFNPNLYPDGTVCLSVLGTWSGPAWIPTQTLSSLLVQIQSHIFNEKPYHNEPSYEGRERRLGDSDRYNQVIQHETIRVAVIGMVNNEYSLNIPEALMARIRDSFIAMYAIYESKVIANLPLSGTKVTGEIHFLPCVTLQYDSLLVRLRATMNKLTGVARPLVTTQNLPGKSPDTANLATN